MSKISPPKITLPPEYDFVFGLTAYAVREGEKVHLITTTAKPMPIPEVSTSKNGLLTLLAEWAAKSKGEAIALPITPGDISDPSRPVVCATPPGIKPPTQGGPLPVDLLTQFRVEWEIGDDGAPVDQAAPQFFPFDEAIHTGVYGGDQLPERPFLSFDAETWTFAFDLRYRRTVVTENTGLLAPFVPTTPRRTVPRVDSSAFDGSVRIPTITPANGALTALMSPNRWMTNDAGSAIFTQVRDTQVALKCDPEIGFNPERAIQRIAKHGPAIAQTFIAMVNLWMRENKGKDFETYMTGRASDLLRAQGRADHDGGFPLEEQIEKGRQVYDLSMLTVPRTIEIKYGRGQKQTKQAVAIGPLVMVQPVEVGPSDVPGEDGSMVTFRFHITRDIHDAVCGEDGKYAELSSRLLTYHPIKEKYQILIGFSLAYYDRVNRKQSRTHHPISLPALLNMACIEEPERPGRFLEQIEIAINELARDGVIPGLRLEKPKNWAGLLKAKKAREVLNNSKVVFPRMIQAPEAAQTRIASRSGVKQ